MKAYGFEMTDREHAELAEVLRGVRAAVAISGYRCALMDRLYKGWRRADAPPRLCNSSKGERTESVWLNYDPFAYPTADSTEKLDASCLFEKPARYKVRKRARKT